MFTAGDIIGGAFRLFRERPAAVAVWLALYLAMTVAVQWALRPVLHDIMLQPAGGVPDFARMAGGFGTMSGIYLLMMVGVLLVYAACLRAVVRPLERRFAYLRLGMDELRLLALALLFVVGFGLLYLVMALLTGLLAGVLSQSSPGGAIVSVIVAVTAILAVLMFLYVRLSLAFPLTMLRRRIVIGEAWRLSAGRFWMLFGAYLVVMLIVVALLLLLTTITSGSYFADMAQLGLSPEAGRALQRQQMERQFGAVTAWTLAGWLLAALAGTAWLVLGAGATGTAAVGLLDDRFADVGAIYE